MLMQNPAAGPALLRRLYMASDAWAWLESEDAGHLLTVVGWQQVPKPTFVQESVDTGFQPLESTSVTDESSLARQCLPPSLSTSARQHHTSASVSRTVAAHLSPAPLIGKRRALATGSALAGIFIYRVQGSPDGGFRGGSVRTGVLPNAIVPHSPRSRFLSDDATTSRGPSKSRSGMGAQFDVREPAAPGTSANEKAFRLSEFGTPLPSTDRRQNLFMPSSAPSSAASRRGTARTLERHSGMLSMSEIHMMMENARRTWAALDAEAAHAKMAADTGTQTASWIGEDGRSDSQLAPGSIFTPRNCTGVGSTQLAGGEVKDGGSVVSVVCDCVPCTPVEVAGPAADPEVRDCAAVVNKLSAVQGGQPACEQAVRCAPESEGSGCGLIGRLAENASWDEVFQLLWSRGVRAFVSGGPETGKATLLRRLLSFLLQGLAPNCDVIVIAPTNTSAKTFCGVAYHGFFGFVRDYIMGHHDSAAEAARLLDLPSFGPITKLLGRTGVVLLDDVSLVSAAKVDIMHEKSLQSRPASAPRHILFAFGDFVQLLPMKWELAFMA